MTCVAVGGGAAVEEVGGFEEAAALEVLDPPVDEFFFVCYPQAKEAHQADGHQETSEEDEVTKNVDLC